MRPFTQASPCARPSRRAFCAMGAAGLAAAIASLADLPDSRAQAMNPAPIHGNAATALTLSSTALAFSPQQVGTSSAAQSITITNTGAGALRILGVFPSGSNPGDFPFSPACPGVLPPHTSCSIQVSFQPTYTGFRSGNVVIFSDAASSPDDVFLEGTGTAAASPPPLAVVAVPTFLNFRDQAVGTVSPAMTTTLTNTGADPVTVNSASVSAGSPFAVLPFAPVSLTTGQSTTVGVVFQPSVPGILGDTLTVGTSAGTLTLPLAGFAFVGIPAVTVSPRTVDFGNQGVGTTSAAQTITVTSTGTGPLTMFGAYPSGADPSDFPFLPACFGLLAPGDTCTLQVSFSPTTTGFRSSNVVFFSNAPSTPDAVILTGRGR